MFRRHASPLLLILAALGLLAACGTPSAPPAATAMAALAPTGAVAPNPVAGSVRFTALPHGVRVAGEVRGLAPNSEHGFHIHEKGDCADDGNAAGGHFNAGGTVHGQFDTPASHAGDLPSLRAGDDGTARLDVEAHAISLGTGAPNDVLGRALVVHRDRDDFTSQPAGNSGPRLACAVITR